MLRDNSEGDRGSAMTDSERFVMVVGAGPELESQDLLRTSLLIVRLSPERLATGGGKVNGVRSFCTAQFSPQYS